MEFVRGICPKQNPYRLTMRRVVSTLCFSYHPPSFFKAVSKWAIPFKNEYRHITNLVQNAILGRLYSQNNDLLAPNSFALGFCKQIYVFQVLSHSSIWAVVPSHIKDHWFLGEAPIEKASRVHVQHLHPFWPLKRGSGIVQLEGTYSNYPGPTALTLHGFKFKEQIMFCIPFIGVNLPKWIN